MRSDIMVWCSSCTTRQKALIEWELECGFVSCSFCGKVIRNIPIEKKPYYDNLQAIQKTKMKKSGSKIKVNTKVHTTDDDASIETAASSTNDDAAAEVTKNAEER